MTTAQPRHWMTITFAALLLGTQAHGARLPSFNVDLRQTSVSGISSGGFMSVQLHLAHSSIIKGVGVFAGGPYECARNSATRALQVCMPGGADAPSSIEHTRLAFRRGAIDDPANLTNDKVWLFSGYNDGVVKQETMDALYAYYNHFTDAGNLYYQDNMEAGHAQVTPDFGDSCATTGGTFINDCDYDGAGALLQHIYGRLAPPTGGAPGGRILAFEQGEFVAGSPRQSGLADTAYLYVPAACASGARCRVHVAFHGCLQNAGRIGETFVREAGYNEWADGNRIIVLYPQTVATHTWPYNPKACWDWWGYADEHYAPRHGRQISAVRAMLGRLSGEDTAAGADNSVATGFGPPRNLTAIDSADDAVALAWSPVEHASGYNLYRSPGGDGEPVRLNSAPITGASYGDSELMPETAYAYRITAIGPSGESKRSDPIRVTTGSLAPPCDPSFADNLTHTLQGRAYALFGRTYAKSSNEPMGWWNIYSETNLYRDAGGYRVGTCPAP